MKYIAAACSTALLLNLANAPFNQGYLAFLAVVPLYLCWQAGWKQRFFTGWLAGFLTQAAGYYWIFFTIRDFSGQNTAISLAGGILFWLYQGLDFALWLALTPGLLYKAPKWLRPIGAAAVWLILQNHLFPYVFQWNYGAALASVPLVSWSAVLWDVQGLSFFAIWLQCFWAEYRKTTPKLIKGTLAIGLAFFCGLFFFRKQAPVDDWTVAVVQPNLIPWAKQGRMTADDLFLAHYEPSLAFKEAAPDLIVWPETALAFNLGRYPYYLSRMTELAQSMDAAVITGAVGISQEGRYSNEIWMFTPDGAEPQVYQKEKLVMFSEKLPWIFAWAKFFDNAIGGFEASTENRPFSYRDKEIVPLVCFEALFSDYTRQRKGHLIVNLTNDAWFGKTKASWQHLHQIQLRSVENRVPLVRATNSGISCWIDIRGNIREPGGLYLSETFLYQVPVPRHIPRDYSGWGVLVLKLISLCLLTWVLFTRFRAGRNGKARERESPAVD